MKVTEIMRRTVRSIDSAEDAYEAGKVMLDEDGGYVLIENNDTVIGIITWRDFTEGILKFKTSAAEIKVRHIMSTPVHMIESESNLEAAIALMNDKKIRRLPVLREERIIGIILAEDMMNSKGVNHEPKQVILEER